MKRALLFLILISILPSLRSQNPKVLMFIQEKSNDLGYMLNNEAFKMKALLEQSGFDVVTASISGEVLKADQVALKPDLKLNEVNVDDYSGFILPCMSRKDTTVTSGEISFVRKVVYDGKPIAAQNGGVWTLGRAGVLNGKKYAMEVSMGDYFPKNCIYSGNGVVQDGNIITSGTCPMHAKETGNKDGTVELTQKLIQLIKDKN